MLVTHPAGRKISARDRSECHRVARYENTGHKRDIHRETYKPGLHTNNLAN